VFQNIPEMTFKSAVDLWLLVIVALVVIISLSVSVRLVLQRSPAGYLRVIGVLAIGIGLPLWFFYSTQYLVEDEVLKIQSGPFTWTISITSISQVVDTSNLLSSPALSLRRLKITYGESKTVMVSPKDREGFLEAIDQR
jgi:membrane protein YdbS with pleckstrin-like domain